MEPVCSAVFLTEGKKNGAYHQTSRRVISKDGKTKIQTVKGTDAGGKSVVARLVYEKQ